VVVAHVRVPERQLAAWRALIGAQSRVVRRVERALAESGLPPLAWYDVLYALYEAPARRLRIRELAEAVVLSPTGMSRLVDRIEAAGCLRREPVPDDRRGAYAVLTEEGRALLRRMWKVYAAGIAEHFAQPVGRDAARIRPPLERVVQAAENA
jgi:DNA-binding MarR family transcriptional regulator